MGYDTAVMPAWPLPRLYLRAHNEDRVIVTRDAKVVAGSLTRVVKVRSQQLEEQLRQLLDEKLVKLDGGTLFTRCDICNVPVEPIEPSRVTDRVPPYVAHTQTQFWACPSCHRIYWAATHWRRARALFARLRTPNPEPRTTGNA
jgi:uncharacterized protein with PIN domain